MKRFFLGLIMLLLIAVSVYGKWHYDQKVADTVNNTVSSVSKSESEGKATAAEDKGDTEASLKTMLAGAEEGFADQMRSTVGEGESLTIVAAGSDVVHAQAGESFPALFVQDLKEKYRTDQIELKVVHFGNQTSLDVMSNQEAEQIAALEPDIFIYSPLVLNDDGSVSIDDTLYSLNDMVETVENENPGAAIYIQPPQPMYEAEYYVSRIQQLQDEIAASDNLTYINHWESWPITDDEALPTFVENSQPTAAGHTLWAEHLFTFFTTESAAE
ncbi:SGNH/GDSL hydrolase family protein [Alteribacillus bidgolensis]|uniref:GDSL-like Lipase/Acylhydrolase family protein n=1 Tax=Alteribacillus bidgolensis TaxID=930129 RepID=A0A1G8PPG6_9BACI|nr:SGNH/GDSL hydrolase family protein [Alteribacillus bidgolensis]SDI93730.1 hypothetical protein SAMN05216352_11540 [Alteribacillus bidgolensis]